MLLCVIVLTRARQFGKVYSASLATDTSSTEVAVKLMRVNCTLAEQEDFLGEAELILGLDGPGMLKVPSTQCCINAS